AASPLRVEWLAKIQSVRDRVEHGFRQNIGLGWMKRRRKLNAIDFKLARKIQPVFDRAIGILIANFPWRQFLERRGQHAYLHEFRFKLTSGHGPPLLGKLPWLTHETDLLDIHNVAGCG